MTTRTKVELIFELRHCAKEPRIMTCSAANIYNFHQKQKVIQAFAIKLYHIWLLFLL